MKSYSILTILLTLLCSLSGRADGLPFCTVRHYDDTNGLSQRAVKQILQDSSGLIWLATWDGLHRFDGYEFSKIKPDDNDEARRYSNRFGDLKPAGDDGLWCRVDDRLLRFNLSTYRFEDINSQLEKKFGSKFTISNILTSTEGKTAVRCNDNRYIVMDNDNPVGSAVISDVRPPLHFHTTGNRKLGDIGGYRNSDLVYSQRHPDGSLWLITRDGEVAFSPSEGKPFRVINRIDTSGSQLYYSMTDNRGNIWLRNSTGAYRLTLGKHRYEKLPSSPQANSRLRTAAIAPDGSLWLSESDRNAVAVYPPTENLTSETQPLYLGADGSLHRDFTPFGVPVYAITFTSDSTVWLGSKPGALYRLRQKDAGGFTVDHFTHDPAVANTISSDNVHDIAVDSDGRLWVATLGGGIDCSENPDAEIPSFKRLASSGTYPEDALRVRHIRIAGDSLLLAATTGGLLTARLPHKGSLGSIHPILHVSRPGQGNSLGNIAVMDAMTDKQGNIFIATESDGINMIEAPFNPSDTLPSFTRFNTRAGMPTDITLSAAPTDSGTILVTSNNILYILNPADSTATTYKSSYWNDNLRFTEARPLKLGNGKWLLGVEDGAIICDFSTSETPDVKTPVIFTSVSIQNRADSLLSASSDSVVLTSSERNLTLHFAALDFTASADIVYYFRLDGGPWTRLGRTRSVTFLDMKPGTYTLEVKSTDSYGKHTDNTASMTIVVTPTFWETPLAYCLYILTALGIIAIAVYTLLYIRRIKLKQHETLDAYLRLLEATPATGSNETETVPEADARTERQQPRRASVPELSPTDEAFMTRIVEFVNANISNPEITVDDMAAAVATSRSGLNRKMKSILGVTPGDFIRESRLSRAAGLLLTTDRSVKDIAFDCGFSDLNYFSKCFKSAYNLTPTSYRKSQH